MFHGQDQRGSLVAHTAPIPIQSSNRETEVLMDKVGIPRQRRQSQCVLVLSDPWFSQLQVCPLRLQVMSKAGSCNVEVVPVASKSGSSLECIV